MCFISLFECKYYKYIWWKQKKNNKKLFTAPLFFCPTNNVHIWWNKKKRRIWLIVCLENWYKFWTQTITNQSIDQPLSLFSFQFFYFHLFKIIIKIVNFICFLCNLCYLNIEHWKFEFECLFFFVVASCNFCPFMVVEQNSSLIFFRFIQQILFNLCILFIPLLLCVGGPMFITKKISSSLNYCIIVA